MGNLRKPGNPPAPHLQRQKRKHPVPPARYSFIQKELRAKGKWTYSDSRLKVVSNFERDFGLILKKAAVKTGEFHDLRRTTISDWLAEGLSEFEVMKLAGHADFKTTHKYYLRLRDDSVDRARQASSRALSRNLARTVAIIGIERSIALEPEFGAHLARAPLQPPKAKRADHHK